jgi:hypothetical protein
MRTTLTIDSQVLAEFKKRAAETHRTISGLIEDALREHLSRERDQATTKPLDFPIVGGGGVAPGVDLSSNAALSDYVDRADAVYERIRGPAQGRDGSEHVDAGDAARTDAPGGGSGSERGR